MGQYDRKATEAALIKAVDDIISEKGFKGLGVNAIARRAKVNKALIYRYFGNLDGLYEAFAGSYAIWPSLQELLGDLPQRLHSLPWRKVAAELLTRYAQALRARPRTVELLAWECVDRNALTIAFESVRERRSNELFGALIVAGFSPNPAVRAPIAVISSSINYLAIRSRNIRIFSGVEVGADHFWDTELPQAIEMMLAGLPDPPSNPHLID